MKRKVKPSDDGASERPLSGDGGISAARPSSVRSDRMIASSRGSGDFEGRANTRSHFVPADRWIYLAQSESYSHLRGSAAFCSPTDLSFTRSGRASSASTLEGSSGYTPSDCFETFPFPRDWETDPRLEAAGQAYYEFRAALMVRNDEGLTKTYNRFHDPDEHDPES